MNKILLTIVGVLAWASAGASAADTTAMKAAKEELAKFNQTGQFERCISQNAIKNATIVDDTKIMFELRNNKYVLNTLKAECTRLGIDRQFVYPSGRSKILYR